MTKTFRLTNVSTFLGIIGLIGALALVAPSAEARQTAATTAPPQAQGPATAGPQQPQQVIDRYVVGSARPPIVEGSQLVELTLEQSQLLALEKNLDIKVARMGPQGIDYQIAGAHATFLPTFSGTYGYSNSLSPSTSTLEGVTTVTSIGQNFNGGMSQTLPWYGSRIGIQFSNGRNSTNDVTARNNPRFSSGLNLTYNMPLLNGFKIDNNRNRLRTLQISRQIADIDLLTQIESIKNRVRTSYWNLRSAIENIEIARRSLDIAKKQYDDSLLKVEIGTMAPIETTQFETAVANNEQLYLNSQISWRTAELNFKQLIVSGTDDDMYRATINPVEKPSLSVASVDIQAAVTKALAERTDIVVAKRNLDTSRLNLDVTKQSLMPSLALSGGYRVSGQGGPIRSGNTIIPGGYWDALRAVYGFDLPTWSFGFDFSYPLGMRAARASYAQSVLSIDQSIARLKSQELSVSTAVINAGLNVENTYKSYQAAVKAREASEKNADAAQVRFDNGMLTNFEVVQAQQQLTTSRLSEVNRIIAYMNAIAEFERVQKIGG